MMQDNGIFTNKTNRKSCVEMWMTLCDIEVHCSRPFLGLIFLSWARALRNSYAQFISFSSSFTFSGRELLMTVFHFSSLQELIRRWNSERELFYDDIVHVEACAYAHWIDFLIYTIKQLSMLFYAHNQSAIHLHPSNRVIRVCFAQIIVE